MLTHRRRRPGGGRPQKTASVTLKDIQGMVCLMMEFCSFFFEIQKCWWYVLKTITSKTFEDKVKSGTGNKDQRIWLICQNIFWHQVFLYSLGYFKKPFNCKMHITWLIVYIKAKYIIFYMIKNNSSYIFCFIWHTCKKTWKVALHIFFTRFTLEKKWSQIKFTDHSVENSYLLY